MIREAIAITAEAKSGRRDATCPQPCLKGRQTDTDGETRCKGLVSYRQLTQQIRLRKKIAPFLPVLRIGNGLFNN